MRVSPFPLLLLAFGVRFLAPSFVLPHDGDVGTLVAGAPYTFGPDCVEFPDWVAWGPVCCPHKHTGKTCGMCPREVPSVHVEGDG